MAITPLVADGQVMKGTLATDIPVMTRAAPTQHSEEDAPSHSHRTLSHGIPASPRFEDPPRSPTVIKIERPEQIHPESLTGRSMIIALGERTFSPGYVDYCGYGLILTNLPGRRPMSPAITQHDDGRPCHRLPPAEDDEADPRGRRSASRFPDDEAGPRAVLQVPDDEADPYGRRAASRVPSRTGSQAGGMPAAIQQDDGSRQESEMVPIPPPVGHGHLPDHDLHVHFDPTATGFDDALNRRHERLDEVECELHQVVQGVHDAEDRRQVEFRDSEEHREPIFLQNEQRRHDEARQRGDEPFAQLEERACSLPPLPVPPPGSGDNASIIESIHAASHEAASRHADDILETV
ncbi:hypothetical protein F4604DRAFT_1686251 [Suillus subluteus]|nr:hypothetical protein F4604DRAFT_1686251 [Suillus subluteus]